MIDGTIGRNGQRWDSTNVNIIPNYTNHTDGQARAGHYMIQMNICITHTTELNVSIHYRV